MDDIYGSLMTSSWRPKKKLLATSFDELSKYIELRPIEPQIRFRIYCNSCETLGREGRFALAEGDLEKAYIYFMKFAVLWIEKLPNHPEFRESEHNVRKQELHRKCRDVLDELEKIKTDLKELYPKYRVWLARQEKIRTHLKKKRRQIEEERKCREFEEERNEEKERKCREIEEERKCRDSVFQENLNDERSIESSYASLDSLMSWSNGPDLMGVDLLCQVMIDQELIDRFMENIQNDLDHQTESCGLLSGRLNNDLGQYEVTHLLIPKQKGTENTCHSLNEEDTGVYQIEHELQPLGWIHTHPTQDCFLSSVDLHMQLGFQQVLPEAIAIVCAPRSQPNLGIFHLTPQGMVHLQNCQEGCSFHPHLESGLYEASRHVIVRTGLPKFEIIDFR